MSVTCKSCGVAIDLPDYLLAFVGPLDCPHCGVGLWIKFSDGELSEMRIDGPRPAERHGA